GCWSRWSGPGSSRSRSPTGRCAWLTRCTPRWSAPPCRSCGRGRCCLRRPSGWRRPAPLLARRNCGSPCGGRAPGRSPTRPLRGAHLARAAHDFRTVRRLVEAVPSEQLDAAGALLLGEALYELGAFDASEQVLAAGQGLPSNEHITLRLAVTRAKNAQWGLCQPEKALAINAAA